MEERPRTAELYVERRPSDTNIQRIADQHQFTDPWRVAGIEHMKRRPRSVLANSLAALGSLAGRCSALEVLFFALKRRVFLLGLGHDRQIGVGVLPFGEEDVVGFLRACLVSGH